MKKREIGHIFVALVVLTLVGGYPLIKSQGINGILTALLFSAIILTVVISLRKFIAYSLDAGVNHELASAQRYGWKPHYYLSKPIPLGIILSLLLSIFSLGTMKFLGLLSYETAALKRRAARRFGYYSYTEMTDWHNALIGAAGIVGALLVSFVSYFPGAEYLAKLAAFYAFSNMIPIGKLDGTQIFFGSRPLYAAMAVITLIFFIYALFVIV